MMWFFGVFVFALGAVVGSFLNVVIYRLPRGESLAWPGSRCPSCGHPIRWYDNVPIIGWLLLRGRCRDCRAPIAGRYPLVEGLTAALFLVTFLTTGTQLYTVLLWAFEAALVAITFIDLEHYIIPDKIVLPGAVVGLAASVALAPERWWVFLVSAVGAASFLLILGLVWAGGMGFGDVKMGLLMGAVLGSGVIVALFAGFLLGGVIGAVLLATGVKGRKDKIPFGPYLAAGSIMAALVGPLILDWYLRLF